MKFCTGQPQRTRAAASLISVLTEILATSCVSGYNALSANRGVKVLPVQSGESPKRVLEAISIPVVFMTWVGKTSHLLGEFFREVAALVVVFVPLDLVRPQDHSFGSLLAYSLAGGGTALCVGIVLEYVSAFAYRIKRDLEGMNGP